MASNYFNLAFYASVLALLLCSLCSKSCAEGSDDEVEPLVSAVSRATSGQETDSFAKYAAMTRGDERQAVYPLALPNEWLQSILEWTLLSLSSDRQRAQQVADLERTSKDFCHFFDDYRNCRLKGTPLTAILLRVEEYKESAIKFDLVCRWVNSEYDAALAWYNRAHTSRSLAEFPSRNQLESGVLNISELASFEALNFLRAWPPRLEQHLTNISLSETLYFNAAGVLRTEADWERDPSLLSEDGYKFMFDFFRVLVDLGGRSPEEIDDFLDLDSVAGPSSSQGLPASGEAV